MATLVRSCIALGLIGLFVAVAAAQDRAPGEPIPGMDIKLGRKPPGGGTIVAQGTTDAQGNVRFADLPKGQYYVKVAINGQEFEVAADSAGKPIELAGAATVPDSRAAQPRPQETKKFAKVVGANTAAIEAGADWLKVTLVRGAPISTSRSNIK